MRDEMKDLILEACEVCCSNTAKGLRMAADKADAAAVYCKSQQSGKLSFGIKIKLGDHEFNLGKA